MDATKFYIGKLCKRGHEFENSGGSLRYKKNRDCKDCCIRLSKKYREENKDKIKEYREKNKGYYKNYSKNIIGNIKSILKSTMRDIIHHDGISRNI